MQISPVLMTQISHQLADCFSLDRLHSGKDVVFVADYDGFDWDLLDFASVGLVVVAGATCRSDLATLIACPPCGLGSCF